MRTRGVDLILPDAGPIISLAHADRLDLLQVLARPVMVLDVVERECLKREDSPDHERLRDWFAHGHNQFRRVATPFLGLCEAALHRERTGEKPSATRGMGDATLAWFIANLDEVVEPGIVPLFLTEDRNFSIEIRGGGMAYVLSTRRWLLGLAQAGIIPSVESVMQEMARHGRNVSRLIVDAAQEVDGATTDWIGAARPVVGDAAPNPAPPGSPRPSAGARR